MATLEQEARRLQERLREAEFQRQLTQRSLVDLQSRLREADSTKASLVFRRRLSFDWFFGFLKIDRPCELSR
jgi:hypothetical protein